ncbi:MAG TPA: hypothetical protein VF399_00330 [bacterium]
MKKKSFEMIKLLAEQYTKTAYRKDIKDVYITYAKHDKDIWKVNVEFKEGTNWVMTKSACLEISATSGELLAFYKDRTWQF